MHSKRNPKTQASHHPNEMELYNTQYLQLLQDSSVHKIPIIIQFLFYFSLLSDVIYVLYFTFYIIYYNIFY